MHTDETLLLLESATQSLSLHFSAFLSVTCAAYETRETNKEKRARLKRSANKKTTQKASSVQSNLPQPVAMSGSSSLPTAISTLAPATPCASSAGELNGGPDDAALPGGAAPFLPSEHKGSRLRKSFNLATYKYHALANYAHTIRRFGTTDSYSTERVGLESSVFSLSYKVVGRIRT
jgi:hypothetical protein